MRKETNASTSRSKEIRSPKASDRLRKKKPKLHLSKKAKWVIGISAIAIVVLTLSGFLLASILNRFDPVTTDKHLQMNALPETMNAAVIFKDGGVYLCDKDSSTLIDDKVYDADDIDSLSSVTYFWDPSDGTLVYLSDPQGEKKLMRYQNGDSVQLVKNVSAWRISNDHSKLAVVIDANTSGLGGTLLQFENGKMKLLEYNVKAETIYYSGDSSCLFAQVGTASLGELHRYKDDENQVVDKNMFAMGWLSDDGNSYLSVDVSDTDGIYNYTMKTVEGKSTVFKNVCYSDTSPDGSIMYILYEYNTETLLGKLAAVDTKTLKVLQIATDVYTFNPKAVTNSAEGIVYATKGSIENRYHIYYFTIDEQKPITLAQNAYDATIGGIVINSAQNRGYLLLRGNNTEHSQLYSITIEKDKMQSTKLDEGAIYEVVYFEACDRLVYGKNGDKDHVELYSVGSDLAPQKQLSNCGAIYESTSAAYYSCSIVSNDNAYLVYLKSVVIIEEADGDPFTDHPNASVYGTLMLRRNSDGELFVVATNVLADSFACIQSDGGAQNIFFCTLTTDGKFDIYHYETQSGEKTLLASGADAIAQSPQ